MSVLKMLNCSYKTCECCLYNLDTFYLVSPSPAFLKKYRLRLKIPFSKILTNKTQTGANPDILRLDFKNESFYIVKILSKTIRQSPTWFVLKLIPESGVLDMV